MLTPLCGALLLTSICHAQSVVLTGVMGKKALLIIDGSTPQALAAHENAKGVQVLQVDKHSAIVQIQGQQHTLHMGASPASVGAGLGSHSRKIVMRADSSGHFRPSGHINNHPIQYMVDTGASLVGISQTDARRIGLKYEQGQPVTLNTANGRVQGWLVRLQSVRVGDILLHGVDAVVTPQPMPFVLLGNSFLSQLHMTRKGHEMVLEQR